MLTRRGFLGRLAAAAAGALVCPAVVESPFDWASGADFTVVTQVFQVGDVFTIAGCYAMNPITGAPTEQLLRFMVTSVVDGEVSATVPRRDTT